MMRFRKRLQVDLDVLILEVQIQLIWSLPVATRAEQWALSGDGRPSRPHHGNGGEGDPKIWDEPFDKSTAFGRDAFHRPRWLVIVL